MEINHIIACFKVIWKYLFVYLKWAVGKDVTVIQYGDGKRETMDIYVPNEIDDDKKKCPVVMTSIGGAWVLGGKIFTVPPSYLFQSNGYVAIGLDYGRYPFTSVENQINSWTKAVGWIFENIHNYHGDVNNINLIGFSASGHLALKSMFRQFKENLSPTYIPKRLNAVFLCSAPLNLSMIYNQFKSKVIAGTMLDMLFKLDRKRRRDSQVLLNEIVLEYNCAGTEFINKIRENEIKPEDCPLIYFAHGDEDVTCSIVPAEKLFRLLKENGYSTRFHGLKGWNHLDYGCKDLTVFLTMLNEVAHR